MDFDKLLKAQVQPQAPAMQIATPINDVQLVALVAASSCKEDDPEAAVAWAVQIVAQAILQAGGSKLKDAVRRAAGGDAN